MQHMGPAQRQESSQKRTVVDILKPSSRTAMCDVVKSLAYQHIKMFSARDLEYVSKLEKTNRGLIVTEDFIALLFGNGSIILVEKSIWNWLE